MSFFDQVYERVFGKTGPAKIFEDELIHRSKSFEEKLEKWKRSDNCREVLENIWQSYFWQQRGIDKTPVVQLLQSNTANGLAVGYVETGLDKQTFYYLFDHIKDQVMDLGYLLITSKVSNKEKGEGIETKEMHYLKPKRNFEVPIDQRFGNVLVELYKVDDTPTHIKLVANTYQDRNYREPESFELLTKYLFNKNL